MQRAERRHRAAEAKKVRGGAGVANGVTCDECGKKNHDRTTCWVLHPHLEPPGVNGREENATAREKKNEKEADAKAKAKASAGDVAVGDSVDDPAAVRSEQMQNALYATAKLWRPESSFRLCSPPACIHHDHQNT